MRPTGGDVVVDGTTRLIDMLTRDRLAYRRRAQMLQQETELSSLQAQEAAAQKITNDADAVLKDAILNFAT